MGIPLDLAQAAELVCTRPKNRAVSVGRAGEQYFILRAHTGITRDQSASRELKDHHQVFAYIASALRFVSETPEIRFRITYDGKEAQVMALTCIVNNLGGFGEISPYLNRSDPGSGLFDVLFVSKNVNALGEFSSYMIDLDSPDIKAHHIIARDITVEAHPPQPVWMDGEFYGQTPVTFHSLANAVNILVP